MSNVLIGIIGVILFIGLALAGALYLGSRFQDTKSTSTAAAATQAVTQISSAIVLSNTNLANTMTAGTDPATLVSGGFLKSIPGNPGGTDALVILSKDGESSVTPAGMVVARLSTTAAASTCGSIVRQTRNANDGVGTDGYVTATDSPSIPQGPAGCFKVGATAINALQPNQFYAFARL